MSSEQFDFISFIKDSKEVLVNPGNYFATFKLTGGFTEPLIKAGIYGAIAGAFSFLWIALNVSMETIGFLGELTGFMAFIWSIIGAVTALFISAVIVLIISSFCGGNTDFEASLRVSAVLMIIMPVNALFSFTSGMHLTLGILANLIVGLGVSLLALRILQNAMIHSLRVNIRKFKVARYVMMAFIVISLMTGMIKRISGTRYYKDFNPQTSGINYRN